MNRVKPFSPELLKSILTAVDEYQKISPGPYYAAFDVDGTLWNSDIGENFFQYKIDHCALPALRGLDPWDHYLALKKNHPPDAYLWLAQICKDFPLSEVEKWADEALKKFPLDLFEPQKNLLNELQKRNIKIFAVSASVQWAVAAAMPLVGLKKENALGVHTQIKAGVVTDQLEGVVTWREGKAQALLQKTKNIMPLFCCGNTSGDLHLLEIAQLRSLAVQSQLPSSSHAELYLDEQKLLQIAQTKKWLSHSFF